MENDNQYQDQIRFVNIGGQLEVATERNVKMTYTFIHEFKVGRIVIKYERLLILKTARARVLYFAHNNRIARFRRAFVPAASAKLRNYGISISIAR